MKSNIERMKHRGRLPARKLFTLYRRKVQRVYRRIGCLTTTLFVAVLLIMMRIALGTEVALFALAIFALIVFYHLLDD